MTPYGLKPYPQTAGRRQGENHLLAMIFGKEGGFYARLGIYSSILRIAPFMKDLQLDNRA